MESQLERTQNRYVYFRKKARTVCPSCLHKPIKRVAYSMCEFIKEKGVWVDLLVFCENCYERLVLNRIQREARNSQYRVVYVDIRGAELPVWLFFHLGQ
jgi:hypothetical protein